MLPYRAGSLLEGLTSILLGLSLGACLRKRVVDCVSSTPGRGGPSCSIGTTRRLTASGESKLARRSGRDRCSVGSKMYSCGAAVGSLAVCGEAVYRLSVRD